MTCLTVSEMRRGHSAIGVAGLALLWLALLTSVNSSFAQTVELQKDCDTLSRPGHQPDYEPMPSFSIQSLESPRSEPATLVMQISAPPIAFNETSLVRLVCKLGNDYPHADKIDALLFDDKKAARNLAAYSTDQKNHGLYLWHLRGHYKLDRREQIEFIEMEFPEYMDGLLTLRTMKVNLLRTRTK
jgi:hypothetical protein